jgi:glyoxylase-like metal-dependent hydrolase (beta-lactamase superfamily II)
MDSFTYPDPLLVAPGTFLVRHLRRRRGEELSLHVNSLVVLGVEPVLVDTGAARARPAWLEQTFSLVEPGEVRWVVLTHHHADHIGNLGEVVGGCSGARVVTSTAIRAHLDGVASLAAGRLVVLDGAGVLELPDRRLVVVPPPSAAPDASLGLFDAATGLFWAGDAFAAPVPGPVDDAAALPGWPDALDERRAGLPPWGPDVDPAAVADWAERVATLAPTVVASAHGPVVRGSAVGDLLERLRRP